MITKNDIPISSVSWLKSSYGTLCTGKIGTFYEPETKDELIKICAKLYGEKRQFDVIGSTSNIYFRPDYNSDIMVSTRKVNSWEERDNYVYCECGVLVMNLAREMVKRGYMGYEGLIDLPGTVAASIYGNASCFGNSINNNLISVSVLMGDGSIQDLNVQGLKLDLRSSVFKSKEKTGVILSAKLKMEKGNPEELQTKSIEYRNDRKKNQPGPLNNLGSMFKTEAPTKLFKLVRAIGKSYCIVLKSLGVKNADQRRMKLQLLLLGESELLPYIYQWNRYIYKDEKAHILFDRYVALYKRLNKNAQLEIEVKQNKFI